LAASASTKIILSESKIKHRHYHLQSSYTEARNRSWKASSSTREDKNQSELKAAIHYQSSLAKPLPIAILLCRTQV
jgi:hypothetical protein